MHYNEANGDLDGLEARIGRSGESEGLRSAPDRG